MRLDEPQQRLLRRFERAAKSPRLMMLYPPICTGATYAGAPDADVLWEDAPPLGTLYVHIPFCRTRCGFCPFYAVSPAEGEREAYVDAVLAEAARYATAVSHMRFTSVYLGGGSPSMLPPALVERLLDGLGGLLRIEQADVTLEAHPRDVTEDGLRDLCAAGVTRLSLGVQSFDRTVLAACGRADTADLVRPAAEAMARAPLRGMNVDLMYGLPGQTLDAWIADLDAVAGIGIASLTLYATVYLPAFQARCEARGFAIPTADDRHAMYDLAHERLGALGYPQPRLGAAAFLRDGLNEHRRNVALGRPTLGLGTWAYSSSGAFAYHNRTPADAWARDVHLGRLPIRQLVRVPPDERVRKDVVEALLLAYVDLDRFKTTWGVDLAAAFPAELGLLDHLGLAHVEDGELRLTRAGARHLREIRYLFASPAVADALESGAGEGL